MMEIRILTLVMACALLMSTAAAQVAGLDQDKKPSNRQLNQQQQEVIASEAFLSNHPDMLNRIRAMQELERGNVLRAANYFKRAARYADKQSQAAYAEMLWEGRAVPQDRPAAYAWMDLASERGYTVFLRFRERYWDALSAQERQRALEVGPGIYAEYGDEVAKPRLEAMLRRASRNVTGSRVGALGSLQIIIPGLGEGAVIDASTFYDKRFWQPAQYWQWQGEIVEGAREGKIIVGELKTTPESAVPETKSDD